MLVIPLLRGLTRTLGIPWWKRCGVRTLADRRGIRLLSVNSQAIPIAEAELPRPPPPALVVRPRRQLLRPNFGHPQALGERVVETHYLPDRERRRLAEIRLEPPPPHAKNPIASPQIFLGSQPWTRGISVRVGKVLGTSLQKRNFNSKTFLLILINL
jgi:hypothetical protein